jgi:hypothetical protein
MRLIVIVEGADRDACNTRTISVGAGRNWSRDGIARQGSPGRIYPA